MANVDKYYSPSCAYGSVSLHVWQSWFQVKVYKSHFISSLQVDRLFDSGEHVSKKPNGSETAQSDDTLEKQKQSWLNQPTH